MFDTDLDCIVCVRLCNASAKVQGGWAFSAIRARLSILEFAIQVEIYCNLRTMVIQLASMYADNLDLSLWGGTMLDFTPLGLAEPPFSLSPDPRFFFLSAQHKTALAKITYTAEQREGLSVVYGDVGVGKTTIARRIHQLYRDNAQYETAYLPMPIYPSEFQLLKAICSEFGLPPKRSLVGWVEARDPTLGGFHIRSTNLPGWFFVCLKLEYNSHSIEACFCA